MIMVGTTLGSLVVAEDRDLPKKKTNIIGNIIRFFFYLFVWIFIALFRKVSDSPEVGFFPAKLFD